MASGIPIEVQSQKPDIRERVRKAIIALNAEGSKITIQSVRKVARCDYNSAAPVVTAYKTGKMPPLTESWGDIVQKEKTEASGLVALIESAQTNEDLFAASKEVAKATARGDLSAAAATAIKGLLSEARQNHKAAKETSEDESDLILYCTTEAIPLIEMFEGIVSDEARAHILTYVQDIAKGDAEENPPVPAGSA